MTRKLDIVIVSYNVRDLIIDCLKSIYKQKEKKDNWKVIIPDCASSDDSVSEIKKHFPQVKLILSKINLGFSKGNNLARKFADAEYVLFLNPDTEIKGKVIQKSIEILDNDPAVGAVGCKVMLPNGKLDYSCHRGLPTVWNSISYFTGLSKIYPKSNFFAGYEASYLDYHQSHEIDCITGAFMMVRRDILEKINWWDEDYFWNGEDIEMCYKIKKLGYKIWYESSEEIIHYKGSSSGLYSTAKTSVSKEVKIKTAKYATRAMRLFIEKHWRELGFPPFVFIAWFGVWILEKIRLAKIQLGLKYA
jgi:GT2 family glycosyltransferase